MAFSDPQTVTVGGVAITLPRTSSGVGSSAYTKDDATTALTVSHSYGKRTRRVVGLNTSKITADPFLPSTNSKVSDRVYLVMDVPPAGFSITEVKDQVVALATWLTASSAANTLKVLGGES